MHSKIVCAIATAGFRQAPVLDWATQIIARRVNATARHERKPSLVGEVFPVFTSRLIITKMKVQIISIWNALWIATPGYAGSRVAISLIGTCPFDRFAAETEPVLLYNDIQAKITPTTPPKTCATIVRQNMPKSSLQWVLDMYTPTVTAGL